MTEKNPIGLSQELLNDFFSEADEHLLSMRRALVDFENSGSDSGSGPKLVGLLFHHAHSFKGISAIVGLEPAEALAHATEDLLRLMRSGTVQLTEQGLDVLSAVVQKLEQIVAAFRVQKPLPGHESLLADIKRQTPDSTAHNQSVSKTEAKAPPPLEKIEEPERAGLKLWKYTFSPSHELSARKININTIREELSKIGEIVKSTPVVKEKGIIVFEFLISTKAAPKNPNKWKGKGVTITEATLEEASATATAVSPSSTASGDISNPFLAPSHLVRVDLKRLDDLLRIAGELVIDRSRLNIQLAQLGANGGKADLSGVQEVNGRLGRTLRELRGAIMRMRLIQFQEFLQYFEPIHPLHQHIQNDQLMAVHRGG